VSFAELGTGAVIRYPYLWSHQAGQGETEGRRSQPVVVGVRLSRPKGEVSKAFLLPLLNAVVTRRDQTTGVNRQRRRGRLVVLPGDRLGTTRRGERKNIDWRWLARR
jgi:hypothetical protein